MPDRSPSRLEMLRFLERVQVADLKRTRRWITEEERRERERQAGLERRPAPPGWLLDYGLSKDAVPLAAHVGGCHMAGKRTRGVDSDTVRRVLAGGVPACSHCRPDTELGILD
ncbi:DUF6233 domain-containing protein [Streptomyces griseosporeus]|uniref:DUF6233 domain-containing protein n=1 Tax=Streptomyces griseosporeus TaxID=1910 RepID=UPI0037030FAC